MSTTRRRLTEGERAQQRSRDRELTVRAVDQLRTSAGWQAWLRVRARTGLRRYSLGNQLLIALQKLASHCLLGRDGCTPGPADCVNRRRSATPRFITSFVNSGPSPLDRMSRHRRAT